MFPLNQTDEEYIMGDFKIKTMGLVMMGIMATLLFASTLLAITSKQEEEISKEFLKMVFTHYHVIEDPLISGYVNDVGKKLVAGAPPQAFKYQFYVIDQDEYNAFAGPGGQVFINSGLFMAMEGEPELAGILGHEIAHVACRHISESIERSEKISLGTLAGVAAGIFLGIGGASTAASAVTFGSMAAGQTILLKYSRENEIQADQIGLGYLSQAGYGGEGLLSMLKKIRAKQWFGSEQIPTYLVTHPAVEDRITYITTMLEKKEAAAVQSQPIDTYLFERARTRLLGVYAEESLSLAEFKTAVAKEPSNSMSNYGYGLALERSGNRKEAIRHLKKALEKKAFDPYILRDLGRVYFLDAQAKESISTLKSAIQINPDCGEEAYLYLGRAYAEQGSYKEAERILLSLTQKSPPYAMAFYYLAEVYGKEGYVGEPNYYLGLYNHQMSHFPNAEFHLKKAIETLKDPKKIEYAKKVLKEIRKRGRSPDLPVADVGPADLIHVSVSPAIF